MVDYSFSIRQAESNVVYLPFPSTSTTGLVQFLTAPTSGGTFTEIGTAQLGANRTIITLSASQSASLTLPAFYQVRIGGSIAFNGKVFAIEPSDSAAPGNVEAYGYVTWSCDPFVAQSSAGPAATGRLLMTMVNVDRSTTIDKGYFNIAKTATTPVSAQNFMGVYNMAGTLLGGKDITGDIVGSFDETNSLKDITFATPFAVTPGKYWVAFLFNAAVAPSLYRAKTAFVKAANGNLAPAAYRVCTNSTGLTALPSTIVPANNVADVNTVGLHWVALS